MLRDALQSRKYYCCCFCCCILILPLPITGALPTSSCCYCYAAGCSLPAGCCLLLLLLAGSLSMTARIFKDIRTLSHTRKRWFGRNKAPACKQISMHVCICVQKYMRMRVFVPVCARIQTSIS